MTLFKIVWGVDAIATLIVLGFFVIGLSDGTVSSFNMGLWLIILAVLGVIMLGSVWLRTNNHPGFALALLCVLAIPAMLYLLFILVMVFGNVKMQ